MSAAYRAELDVGNANTLEVLESILWLSGARTEIPVAHPVDNVFYLARLTYQNLR
jgi:hypothetical protein